MKEEEEGEGRGGRTRRGKRRGEVEERGEGRKNKGGERRSRTKLLPLHEQKYFIHSLWKREV